MTTTEAVSRETLQTIGAGFEAVVGGKIEVSGGNELDVEANKYPRLPLGGPAEKISLIESFPPYVVSQLTVSYEQAAPREVIMEVHPSGLVWWGVASRYESDGSLSLHACYNEERPADYPEFSALWEEVNVQLYSN